MLRAPMSRMDILTPSELDAIINASEIAERYNEVIDSESAYEILNGKIKSIQSRAEKSKPEAKRGTTSSRTKINPVIKVVTSATFIRGVFGILNKVFK